MIFFERIKPSSSHRTRLLLASLIWTLVGAGLLVAGARWIVVASGAKAAAWLAAALLIGWLKAATVLRRRAEANAMRIVAAGDGRCLGGLFTFGAWGLVLFMIILGIGLRGSEMPREWLGLIYVAAGSALLGASLVSWSHWRRARVGGGRSDP